MSQSTSKAPSIVEFIAAAKRLGFEDIQVTEMSDSTRSAQEAAHAIGCEIKHIVKSIVFKSKETAEPILVLASGSNRIDEKLIAKSLGQKLSKADAEFVKNETGFTIGGIPPFGHKKQLITFIDESLCVYSQLWAAAGTPFAVFPLTPAHLLQYSEGKVISVCSV